MSTDNTAEKRVHPVWRILRYLAKRFFTISLTIISGIFLTILIINRTGQLDYSITRQVQRNVDVIMWQGSWGSNQSDEFQAERDRLIQEGLKEAGLFMPYLQRHAYYTFRALKFDWGEMLYYNQSLTAGVGSTEIGKIVLSRLPNTLLLMCTAYLLLFLTGIPLALTLSRKNDSFLDRLMTFLSPISSIPSWVHGVLLILLVAVPVEWLPLSGMYDSRPPDTQIGYAWVILRHMILPVTAILLSMYFQLVYTWRTYFLLFSEEEYVELATAQGIKPSTLQKKYILRPSLPYVITSFAMTLVGFWQTATALEVIFQWPGIGYTYIKSLPNFFGESMYPGELSITVAIVVIFAYLLGTIVLLLDVVYVLVDPRLRLENQDSAQVKIKLRKVRWKKQHSTLHNSRHVSKPHFNKQYQWRVFKESIKRFFLQLRRYPSAIIGFFILSLFFIGSLYAIVFYPYKTAGAEWNSQTLIEKNYTPRNAKPQWTNFFRRDKLPESITLNSISGDGNKTITKEGENTNVNFTFTFDYPYTGDIPQDIVFLFEPTIDRKNPFVTITWISPDGRETLLNGGAVYKDVTYSLTEKVSARKLLRKNPDWNEWYIPDGVEQTESLWLLFAEPEGHTQRIQAGTYQIIIDALMFEENNDIDVKMILVGQVYGTAGTDFMRRDLMFPLLWGMPFVIILGLFGATITTILALILAAVSVWYGGWIDNIIQRLTEANMILPILAISILVHVLFQVDMLIIIGIVILLNVFSSPTKIFRSAFLQIKDAPYIEAARVYGASNTQLVFRYMIPRIIPVLIPQLVILIPSYVFLEATFGLFNIRSLYPTWGRVIYEALRNGATYGSKYWVLEPLFLLLLTGFAFTLLGSALDRVLNPKLNKG